MDRRLLKCLHDPDASRGRFGVSSSSASHADQEAKSVAGSRLRYPPGHPMVGESIDLAFGVRSTYGTGVPEEEIPRSFGLRQNVPNPWNPTTTIEYDVPAGGGRVTLQIFDVSGRFVATLVDGSEMGGRKTVVWHGVDDEGRELPSGVYFYRLRAPGHETTRKMLLLK